MFNPNAKPEDVAARAAELSIEQLERLHDFLQERPNEGAEFYKQAYEIVMSAEIAKLMGGYAVLKGLVASDRARLVWIDRRSH